VFKCNQQNNFDFNGFDALTALEIVSRLDDCSKSKKRTISNKTLCILLRHSIQLVMDYYVPYKKLTVLEIYRVIFSIENCTKLIVGAFKAQKVHYIKWNTLYIITSFDLACHGLLWVVQKAYSSREIQGESFNRIMPQTGLCFQSPKVHYFKWDTLYIIRSFDSACHGLLGAAQKA